MNEFADFLGRLMRGLFKLMLGLGAAVFLLSFLLAALLAVLVVTLWSLLTGRKPAPVLLFQQFRQARQRYGQGMFRPGQPPAGDVVDVQATEVREAGALDKP